MRMRIGMRGRIITSEPSQMVELQAMDWVGLPAGVRFDPSDEELLRHLAAKVGVGKEVSHPRIDDFISHLDGNDGICQTHPENLPGECPFPSLHKELGLFHIRSPSNTIQVFSYDQCVCRCEDRRKQPSFLP